MAIEQLPQDARRVIVLINPKAGWRSRKRRIDSFITLLEASEFDICVSSDLAEATDKANEAHGRGELRAIVGIGGDGTAAELLNRTEPRVPITLLPAGTANLVSRHFRLPKHPAAALKMLREGRICRFDAGKANDRLFLVMVSCGFDAAAVAIVHQRRQAGPQGRYSGYASYLQPIWNLIRTYPYPEIRVELCDTPANDEGKEHVALSGRWMFVFNLPQYAWGLPLAPRAVGTDGLLDLCTFARGGFWKGLYYLINSQIAIHGRLAECTLRQGTRFRISSPADVPYQLDGDPSGHLPIDVEVVPDRVSLVIPQRVRRPETAV